jgi:cytochrome d ubiquinol oxidase subunit I
MLSIEMDRATMAYTLAAHIIIVSISLALPIIMVLAEYLGYRKGNVYFKTLAKRLSTALVIFFAVGTASGIAVASELLVLFPGFMSFVGKVAILPFYIEVFAFFGESVLLGIYVYSWNKVANRKVHMLMGALIAVFANLSGVLIIMINAWMNTPNGFNILGYEKTGILSGVNPLAVFLTNSTPVEELHALGGTLFTGAFLMTGYFAYRLLKSRIDLEKEYYKSALKISFALTFVLMIFVAIGGTLSMDMMFSYQPLKYAVMDLDMVPHAFAYEMLFGFKVPIPGLQSILATGSPSGIVPGLSSYPSADWAPLWIHDTFDAMVLTGTIMGLLLLAGVIASFIESSGRKSKSAISRLFMLFHPTQSRLMLKLLPVFSLVALFTLEDGWVTDEVGRQPYIIYNVMKTYTAANTSASVIPVAIALMLFYVFIYFFTAYSLKRIFSGRDLDSELESNLEKEFGKQRKTDGKASPGGR